ncbi:MAG: SAM hydrolase/SAM-dependent halogenase family protein [Limisphaerales bacterium]
MITFCSDFGTSDPYAAIAKGIILSINPKAEIIDISHELVVHDIRRAAFFVAAACPVFPSGAIHLCVVDPGVGSARRPILLVTERGCFVGPDNGLFSLIWKNNKKKQAYWLKNSTYFFTGTSRTFDARDIFGPVAAGLSLGIAPREFGPELSSIKLLRFPEPVKQVTAKGKGRRFTGEIIYIDRFGNLVTNFPYQQLPERSVEVKIGNRTMRGLAPNYGSIPKGRTAPLWGSLGYLEIAGNAQSARKLLKTRVGMKVELTFL